MQCVHAGFGEEYTQYTPLDKELDRIYRRANDYEKHPHRKNHILDSTHIGMAALDMCWYDHKFDPVETFESNGDTGHEQSDIRWFDNEMMGYDSNGHRAPLNCPPNHTPSLCWHSKLEGGRF